MDANTFTLDGRIAIDSKSTTSDGQLGYFTGIVSTDDLDLIGDVIEVGAFLPINEANIALLYAHDQAQPIGRWDSIRQEGGKLIARGALLLSLQKARDCYEMLKHGVINALSVGFRIEDPSSMVRDAAGRRRIRRAKLHEISLVSVPANSACRIIEVRRSTRLVGSTAASPNSRPPMRWHVRSSNGGCTALRRHWPVSSRRSSRLGGCRPRRGSSPARYPRPTGGPAGRMSGLKRSP